MNLECDKRIVGGDDLLDEREGTVVELHAESGQSSHRGLNVQKLKNQRLFLTKNFAWSDHVDLKNMR